MYHIYYIVYMIFYSLVYCELCRIANTPNYVANTVGSLGAWYIHS